MRYYLNRVKLGRDGYDQMGSYWGLDAPLYYYESIDSEHHGHLRAYTREDARAELLKKHPDARFFR